MRGRALAVVAGCRPVLAITTGGLDRQPETGGGVSVRPVCVEPHPVLRQRAQTVEAFTDDLHGLARDLIDTMYASDGIGLAAPQVGCGLRLFVANPSQERGRELVVVNPSLDASSGRAAVIEGCLSLPEVWDRVTRAAHVRVSGHDVFGRPVSIEAEGLLAIVLQHEFDHLEGRLFIDRLSWFRRWRAAWRLRVAARR